MKHPDFIVIGSGIAGLNFALSVANLGKVLIITKKQTVRSSTNHAQGGIAAVLSKTDDFEKHVQDTLEAGSHHNVKDAVEFMVKKGPEAIKRLIEYGVEFAHHDGKIVLTREGGHSSRRIAFVGDYTGREIERALVKNVNNHPNIEIWEHATAIDLLTQSNTGYGVRIIRNNKVEDIYSKFTVIATGGIGQLYKHTTNPRISTGDGLAMGIRAGITTKDLEFIQFHPTALSLKGKKSFLLSEALRGEGAHLINSRGKRFTDELSPRDKVARAIYEEMSSGPVYLTMSHLDAEHTKIRFPHIYSTLLTYGLNLTQDKIPISPAAHYICGGLQINRHGETCIKNVYAFGEVSWTGVHGANRLASNSLLEALVYSSQISQDIQKKISKHPKNKKSKLQKKPIYKQNSPHENKFITQTKSKLKHIMWDYIGIVRTQEKLTQGLSKIHQLQEHTNSKFPINITNEKINTLRNILTAAEAITQAALKRKESLGAHYIDNK